MHVRTSQARSTQPRDQTSTQTNASQPVFEKPKNSATKGPHGNIHPTLKFPTGDFSDINVKTTVFFQHKRTPVPRSLSKSIFATETLFCAHLVCTKYIYKVQYLQHHPALLLKFAAVFRVFNNPTNFRFRDNCFLIDGPPSPCEPPPPPPSSSSKPQIKAPFIQ